MFKLIAGFIAGFLLAGTLAWAALIPSPPPVEDRKVYLYLKQLHQNLYRMPVETTNPDGAQRGRRGDFLLLRSGGNDYLEVNVSTTLEGGTTWRGVQLTDTP